jgi:hypothetical protein
VPLKLCDKVGENVNKQIENSALDCSTPARGASKIEHLRMVNDLREVFMRKCSLGKGRDSESSTHSSISDSKEQ